jgi:hypothetical protein
MIKHPGQRMIGRTYCKKLFTRVRVRMRQWMMESIQSARQIEVSAGVQKLTGDVWAARRIIN